MKLHIYHYAINSIDLAMEVMSRAYVFSEKNAAKEDENYRIFSLMENAEEEKERQTAALLSWEMVLLYKITLNSSIGNSLPLGQSEFDCGLAIKVGTISAGSLRPVISLV